jgi:hypothetical protein
VFVGWSASFGLFVLWICDQLVYQTLLHSVFVHGLFVEWSNPSLPQIRTKIYSDNLNVSFKLSLLYIMPMALFFILELYFGLCTAPFEISLGGRSPPWVSGALLAFLLVSHVAVLGGMLYATQTNRKLARAHGAVYPDEFRDYLGKFDYNARLRKQFAQSAALHASERLPLGAEGSPKPESSARREDSSPA